MNIVLNPASTSKKTKNKLQQRFDKLQQQLSKQQKLNSKFQQELDELVGIYQTHLLQMDSDMIEPLTRLTSKLIDFYSRKSLAQWHREELGIWISENIERIGRVKAETARELHGRVRQIIADQMGISEAELEEQVRRHGEAFEEAVHSDRDAESAFEEAFGNDPQEDMFGFEDVFAEDIFGEQTAGEGFFHNDGDNSPGDEAPGDKETRRQRLMDGSWVRSLFRRAAQAMHPDREPDPEQRQLKQRSMQQLLAARKQGDIMTLLRLYSECVEGNDLVLAEQEMTGACELMEEQLHDLRAEKTATIYDHPLRTLVHDLFYSNSRKTREQRIHAWKQDLKASAEQTSELIEELRNLKVLKVILEERRDDYFFGELETIFDERW